MSDKRELYQMIKQIINEETKFMRIYLGKVADVDDSEKLGRVLCLIPSLLWKDNDQGAWCSPIDKNSVITPKIDDWVLVQFINNDSRQPVYTGLANFVKDIIQTKFDGKATTQILFEDNNDETYIKYDEKEKVFTYKDSYSNNAILDKNGIDIKDQNNNEIIFKSGEMDIKADLLKILGATEQFVKGTTLKTMFTTLCATIATATSGSTAQNASGIETIKSAFSTFNGQLSNMVSTKIKGE